MPWPGQWSRDLYGHLFEGSDKESADRSAAGVPAKESAKDKVVVFPARRKPEFPQSMRPALVNSGQEVASLNAFDRITFAQNIMGGRACLRGMRITVSLLVNLVANDMSTPEILKEYPDLEAEDIKQALAYAAALANDEFHPFAPTAA